MINFNTTLACATAFGIGEALYKSSCFDLPLKRETKKQLVHWVDLPQILLAGGELLKMGAVNSNLMVRLLFVPLSCKTLHLVLDSNTSRGVRYLDHVIRLSIKVMLVTSSVLFLASQPWLSASFAFNLVQTLTLTALLAKDGYETAGYAFSNHHNFYDYTARGGSYFEFSDLADFGVPDYQIGELTADSKA